MQEAMRPNQSHVFGPNEYLAVIGAGFTGTELYLPKLRDLGIRPEQIGLVDIIRERADSAADKFLEGNALSVEADVDELFQCQLIEGRIPKAVIVASNTPAHVQNFRAISQVAQQVGPEHKVHVWSEKPVTEGSDFETARRFLSQPNINVNVGYILRFSGVMELLPPDIQRMVWTYGKDRSRDTRPTAGVLPDEIVHPLTSTGYVAKMIGGGLYTTEVHRAEVQYEPFAMESAQNKPGFPERPSSDVYTELAFVTNEGIIETTITSSFRMPQAMRQAEITTAEGRQYVLSYDEKSDTGVADYLRTADGTVIARSVGDKALTQVQRFLDVVGGDVTSGLALTSLDEEVITQHTLDQILVRSRS